MKTNHRWRMDKRNENGTKIRDSSGFLVCIVVSSIESANARLIANAPELLETSKRIAAYLMIHGDDYWQTNKDADNFRKAISKAEN